MSRRLLTILEWHKWEVPWWIQSVNPTNPGAVTVLPSVIPCQDLPPGVCPRLVKMKWQEFTIVVAVVGEEGRGHHSNHTTMVARCQPKVKIKCHKCWGRPTKVLLMNPLWGFSFTQNQTRVDDCFLFLVYMCGGRAKRYMYGGCCDNGTALVFLYNQKMNVKYVCIYTIKYHW